MTQLQEPVRYICKNFPKFFFRLGDVRYQFRDGQLNITDSDQVKALDELLKTNPAFALKFFKVDKAAADEFVRQQMNKGKGVMTGAVKGGVDSQDIINSQTAQPLAERDAELDAMGKEQADELRDKLASDSELVLTQKVENPVVSSVENKVSEPEKTTLEESKPAAEVKPSPLAALKQAK